MPPDLNSLPPSRSPSGSNSPLQARTMIPISNQPPSPPSHSPSHSLAATAALNAGIHNEESRTSPFSSARNRDLRRRRSSVRMNLDLNDPTLPSPGELQGSPRTRAHAQPWGISPQHIRTPSLGELHQELESEQEAQVNRLLAMIRQQQAQIALLSSQSTAVDDSTPTSERSLSLPPTVVPSSNIAAPRPRSPALPPSYPLSRQSSFRSRGSSRTGSPALRPTATPHGEYGEWMLGGSGTRDEASFYQAETQNLTRENQMLKMRIRELERQLSEAGPTSSPSTHPHTPSGLSSPPLEAETAGSVLPIGDQK
ncbi:hypothetical protein M501DRAFT_993297 [Patellaria atrata CBS 101060]|uniref:Uncharacterized protein n=1 Tax=Patellaria atrata CBS 101060 TaxID=1346257 RepID=A0A9P4SGN9_9PEZI|nr:hypothetical protein M501DRAFT_993297 [Patellaria atrata CBS 101060]